MAEYQDIKTNGVTLRCRVEGPVDGPLVLMLHGFPECHHTWDRLLPTIAARGYRVIAPDMRGYGHSDKPVGVRHYGKDTLASDVIGLIDAMGRQTATLVVHDWGGVVGWWTADQYPERISRMAVMNIPHHDVFARRLKTLEQIRKSWYVFVFQLPWLPEWLLRRNDFGWMRGSMNKAGGPPDAISPAEIERYAKESWSQEGCIRGMLSWYRAAVRTKSAPSKVPRIAPPVLVIWGEKDIALSAAMARESVDSCADGRLVLLPNADHFVQHDEPERVENEVLGFLGPAGG